jgi:hypothetical protein
VPGTGPPPPCGCKRATRAATSADVPRTGTGWSTQGPTPTPPTQREDVYVREDELLDYLAAMLSRESGRAPTSEEVPALLRERQTTVVCSHTRWAVRNADTDSVS